MSNEIAPVNFQASNPWPEKSWLSATFDWLSSSKTLGKLVLPAQLRDKDSYPKSYLKHLASANNLAIEEGDVITYDHAALETIQLTPLATINTPIAEKYFIVKFCGNGSHYQDLLGESAIDADRLQATVIAFNYRGVNNSTSSPKKFEDLITDGLAQIERLLKNGVDPMRITIDGMSLGGAVGTMVTAISHKQNQKISLWNDRSLATVAKAAAGFFAPDWSGVSGEISFCSLEATSWSLMRPLGWNADIARAYLSIPKDYRSYMVVGKKSEHSRGDGVIAPRASLHYHVKDIEKHHNEVTGFKVSSIGMFGHNVSKNNLISRDNPNLTGQDLFENFVLRQRR